MSYFCFMRYIFLVLLPFFFSITATAQEKWDLKKCVDYALANNISIKQTDIQAKIADLTYQQSKQSVYPNVSFSGGPAFNNGRNQDPTSFSLITQSFVSANMQLQTSVDIFNWSSKKNTTLASQWQAEAAKANTDKLRNDIVLTIANSYLQILLNKEQEKIAELQLQQSQAQLSNTKKLVNAGSLPELNAAELEAQVARDSATYITAKGNVEQSVLSMKAYMSLDAATPIEIDTPPVEMIPVEKIADLQPDAVYALAVKNLPQQRANEFNLKAAMKNSDAARGSMYPAISMYGSLSSGYNSRSTIITGSQQITPPIGKVTVGGTDYTVYSDPYTIYSTGKSKFTKQLDENFRQSVGLSINVPVFQGGSLKTNWQKSKLNTKNAELQKDADNQRLKQDIYQAYNAATVALEKFNAGKKSVETAERSYGFAKKRYDIGMLGTYELITIQNNLFRAKLENVQNQFDYVFKMKVLEFYKGQGLKL